MKTEHSFCLIALYFWPKRKTLPYKYCSALSLSKMFISTLYFPLIKNRAASTSSVLYVHMQYASTGKSCQLLFWETSSHNTPHHELLAYSLPPIVGCIFSFISVRVWGSKISGILQVLRSSSEANFVKLWYSI